MGHRHLFRSDKPFKMYRGGVLPEFQLAWESWGSLNARRDNAILILTGLSPSAHAATHAEDPETGWWEYMVGPDKPLNSDRYFIICVNSLGSCKGSTGPASRNPDGAIYGRSFPDLSIEDIAATASMLLADLGIERLHTLVGPSMGGMSTLALLAQHPNIAARLISISSAMAATPFTIAIRSLQREIIISDRNYRNGRYRDGEWPTTGMRLARKLGMLSYRSASEWLGRFGRERVENPEGSAFGVEFEIESYLAAHADRFIHGFDPNCYIYLSRSMDWFDLDDHQHSPVESWSLERALVIGVETDILFPLHQQRDLALALSKGPAQVDYCALSSIQGHDAFLVDQQKFASSVSRFMGS